MSKNIFLQEKQKIYSLYWKKKFASFFFFKSYQNTFKNFMEISKKIFFNIPNQ